MQASSLALTLELAANTAQLADGSGDGVASTAAVALVETVGQVRCHDIFSLHVPEGRTGGASAVTHLRQ